MATFTKQRVLLDHEIEMLSSRSLLMKLLELKLSTLYVERFDSVWEGILCQIMTQQLSNHVAHLLLDRISDEAIKTPQGLLNAIQADEAKIQDALKRAKDDKEAKRAIKQVERSLPFSQGKLDAMKTLANMYLDRTLSDDLLTKMSKEQRHNVLGSIKGIGRWTVEMSDIFVFGEKDVFPTADLGVIKAVMKFCDFPDSFKTPLFTSRLLDAFAQEVKPFGTCATVYLWSFASLLSSEQEMLTDIYHHADPNEWASRIRIG